MSREESQKSCKSTVILINIRNRNRKIMKNKKDCLKRCVLVAKYENHPQTPWQGAIPKPPERGLPPNPLGGDYPQTP